MVVFFFSPLTTRSLEHQECIAFFFFNGLKILLLYGVGALTQWFSKGSLRPALSASPGNLARHAGSWTLPWAYWIRASGGGAQESVFSQASTWTQLWPKAFMCEMVLTGDRGIQYLYHFFMVWYQSNGNTVADLGFTLLEHCVTVTWGGGREVWLPTLDQYCEFTQPVFIEFIECVLGASRIP